MLTGYRCTDLEASPGENTQQQENQRKDPGEGTLTLQGQAEEGTQSSTLRKGYQLFHKREMGLTKERCS